jgi:hypothetical protein
MSYKTIGLVLLFVVAGYAQTNDRRDGNWWNEEVKLEKYSYVTGFLDGTGLGEEFIFRGILDKNRNSPCLIKILNSFNTYDEKYFDNVTNGQIVDGLDVFYGDYRNKKILIGNAFWIVLNSIAGKSPVEIEKMTEGYRKSAN